MVNKSLTSSVIRGIGWQVTSAVAVTTIQLAVLAVLGRNLKPAAFGVVAICNIFTGFANLFTDIGIGPAIVQRKELSSRQIQGAFYISVVLGLTLTGLSVLLAPTVERFFNAAGVASVLRWLSLSYVIAAFGSVSKALLERRMAFKRLMQFEICRSLAGAAVAIPMALAGRGVWAIVASVLTGQLFFSGALIFYCRHPALPLFKWSELSEMLGYGSGLTLARFFNQLALNGDYFVVGKLMGPVNLGFYERAYKVMQAPASLLGTILDKVLFPAMSTIQNDNMRLRRGFTRAVSVGYIIQVPVCIGIALMAPEIVELLLGRGWEQSVGPLRILVLSIPLQIMVRLSDSLVRAKGAVYLSAVIKATFAILVVLGSWIGYHWGIQGVACGVFGAVAVNYFLMSALSHRLIQSSWRSHIALVRPAVVVGIVTLLCGIPLAYAARSFTSSPVLVLTSVAAGTVITLGWILVHAPRVLGTEATFLMTILKGEFRQLRETR